MSVYVSFWFVVGHFGSFWISLGLLLDCSGSFWDFWGCFGLVYIFFWSFWFVLGRFGSFWVVLARFTAVLVSFC